MSVKEFMDNNDLGRTGTRLYQAWSGRQALPARLARLARRGRMTCSILRILRGPAGMPVYCEPGTQPMGFHAADSAVAATPVKSGTP